MVSSAIALRKTEQYSAEIDKGGLWLRNKRWDLFFITLSVVVVPLPYVLYLLGMRFGLEDDISRNLVNAFVAIAIGGPHMMSTFLRTGLDDGFKERYPTLIRSSIIIPVIVIFAGVSQSQLDADILFLLGVAARLASGDVYCGTLQSQGSEVYSQERAKSVRPINRLRSSLDKPLSHRHVED